MTFLVQSMNCFQYFDYAKADKADVMKVCGFTHWFLFTNFISESMQVDSRLSNV